MTAQNDERPSNQSKTAADFDAGVADRVVGVMAALRSRVNGSNEDIDAVTSMLWTLGQVPAIADEAQYEAYTMEVGEILSKAGAPLDKEKFAKFIRAPEAARGCALMVRITEWTQRRGN